MDILGILVIELLLEVLQVAVGQPGWVGGLTEGQVTHTGLNDIAGGRDETRGGGGGGGERGRMTA